MAKSGTEILVETLLRASGIDLDAFKREIGNTIGAVNQMAVSITAIDARLKRIEAALHIVEVEPAEIPVKQLTNGAASV